MWFPPKTNAEKYQELLEFVFDEYNDDIGGPNLIFQQDNAPIHRAKLVKEWFQTEDIQVLPWPSRRSKSHRKPLGDSGKKGVRQWEAIFEYNGAQKWNPIGLV